MPVYGSEGPKIFCLDFFGPFQGLSVIPSSEGKSNPRNTKMATSEKLPVMQFSTDSDWNRLLNLLLGYMLKSTRCLGPGADGMTVEDAVKGIYPAAAAAGHVPAFTELSLRHADLSVPLACFFSHESTQHATAC
jgi:hypothetical protein